MTIIIDVCCVLQTTFLWNKCLWWGPGPFFHVTSEIMTTRAHKSPPEINVPGRYWAAILPPPPPHCLWEPRQDPQQPSRHLPRTTKIIVKITTTTTATSVGLISSDEMWKLRPERPASSEGQKHLTRFCSLCSLTEGWLTLCVHLTGPRVPA